MQGIEGEGTCEGATDSGLEDHRRSGGWVLDRAIERRDGIGESLG